MATDLPDYYFRVRDNGATVFRVDTENRQRRIEMTQIAVVNVRNGEIKPQGERQLTQEDVVVIREWMEQRVATLAARDIDDIQDILSIDLLGVVPEDKSIVLATDRGVLEVEDDRAGGEPVLRPKTRSQGPHPSYCTQKRLF